MILTQHSFAAPTIELARENLFPRSEVELATRDGDDDFATHYLTLHMRVGVVLAGAVVVVARDWITRRKLLQPDFVVVVETALVIADEDGGRDVHCIDQDQPFDHPALS
jgi:hypothetical protein